MDNDKEMIKNEIREAFKLVKLGAQTLDVETYMKPNAKSSEFIKVFNGSVFNLDEYKKMVTKYFEGAKDQTVIDKTESFYFINNSTVIYTWTGTVTANLENGQGIKYDPLAITEIFTNVNGDWKIIHSHESTVASPVGPDSL
jgi:hypothetical protein